MSLVTSRLTPNFQLPLNSEAQPPLSRRTRSAEHQPPPELAHASPQVKGDSELAGLFAQILRTAQRTGQIDDIENIPPTSTFGQWWSHLHNVMKNPHFVSWAKKQGIDLSKPIEINHRDNSIAAMVGGQRRGFSGFNEGYLWTSMMAPIMQAAKALTSDSAYIHSPTNTESASYRQVADFYGEGRGGLNREGAGARAAELERSKTFDLAQPEDKRSEEALKYQKSKLGETHDHQQVVSQLVNIIVEAENLSETLTPRLSLPLHDHRYLTPRALNIQKEQFIRNKLSNATITLHIDSPHRRLQDDATISLVKYLGDNGWDIPNNHDQLYNLARLLTTPPLSQPTLGNLGGALSWPTPLSGEDQQGIKHALSQNTLGIDGLQTYDESKGGLDYLTRNQRYIPYERDDPQRFIENLLSTPKAQALGQALLQQFNGVSTPESINDWTLGALGASLEEGSEAGTASNPIRTGVAGFDLARSEHWGKHPSAVAKGLADHLIAEGRANAEMAPIAAHLLLSRRAPAFLVKNIPDGVTYGSHTWVSFSTAVARLEAQAPGSTARMSFAQVMERADLDPVTAVERQVEQMAQREALKDWGVANGIIPVDPQDQYTGDQMRTVISAFNAQVGELSDASRAQSAPFPDRKEMALQELKRVFGDRIPFEEKSITIVPELRDYPGPYSVLDLYLGGYFHARSSEVHDWSSSSTKFQIRDIQGQAYRLPDINEKFRTEFPTYISSAEKAMGTQVKNLIAKLPLEDRKNIEQGKITTLKEYNVSQSGFSQTVTETKINNTLLVKTELDGDLNVYEIDLQKNSIRKRDELKDYPLGPQVYADGHSRRGTMLEEVTPDDSYSPDVTEEKNQAETPNSFASEKTRYIADAMIKNVDIGALEAEAKGITTFDTEVPFYKTAREFLLNLIPLRSAIQNFQQGNIAEGITDLAFDAFGFVVGLGAAARGTRALATGASALSRAARVAKIIGRAAIGALNPADGATDLLNGIASLGKTGVKKVKTTLKTLSSASSYDLVGASKRFDSSSLGTFKQGGDIVQAPAVLQNGKWHHYDPVSGKAYGTALTDFVPSAQIDAEELGKWATADGTVRKVDEATVSNWKKTVNAHRNGPQKDAFEQGYSSGDPQTISGFSDNMKVPDIMKLVGGKNLTAEQVGMLVRKYDDLVYELGRIGSARFIDNIEPRFGEVIPMPQIVYFSQTAQLSDGQCAALARVMATAMAEGKEKMLIKNMLTAAAFPDDPASRDFIVGLARIQNQTGARSAFHAGQSVRQLSVKNMVNELADSTVSKSVMIDSPRHAMAAGVKIDGESKTYYFYDPNFGVANFSSADAMEKALDKLTRDKKLVPQYRTHSTDSNKLEFQIFDHTDDWQEKNSVFGPDVKKLYDAPIPVKSTGAART